MPSCGSNLARAMVPTAAMTFCPLQNTEVSALSSVAARSAIPRAVLRTCPMQDREMPSTSSLAANRAIPRAVVFARPLQNLQTIAHHSRSAKHHAPPAVLTKSPLDDFELPPGGSLEASSFRQREPVGVGILQNFKIAMFGDVIVKHRSLSQSAIEAPRQLRYGGVGRYGLRDFWEPPPSSFPVLRHTCKKRVLVG
ncbi:unnamed protein product [Laminaria digitata]